MEKLLLIAEFSNITTELFNSLSKTFSVKLVPFDWAEINNSLETDAATFAVVYVKDLNREQALSLHRFFQNENYNKIPIILVGSKDECREHVGHWGGNIVKIILTPIIMSELVKEIGEQFIKEPIEKTETDTRKQILVVDDDILFLRTITNVLNESYKVGSVKSGTAAISFLANHTPDLILLDYSMPVCDGPQTFQMIKAEEKTKNIPIFFLTGMSDELHVKQAMALKPEGYILKSCTAEELKNRIGEYFGNKG